MDDAAMRPLIKTWWWLILVGLIWIGLKIYVVQTEQVDVADNAASIPPDISPQLKEIRKRTQEGYVECGNFARVGCQNMVTYAWTSEHGGVATDQTLYFGSVVTVQSQFTATHDMICSNVSTADYLWERNQQEALVQQYVVSMRNVLRSLGDIVCKKYTDGEAGIYKVHYHTGNNIQEVHLNPLLDGDEAEFFMPENINLREIGAVN